MTKSRRKGTPASETAPDRAGEPLAAGQHRDERADEEQVRARAYELYQQRGSAAGDETEDWLQAEREYRERSEERPARGDAEPGLPGQ